MMNNATKTPWRRVSSAIVLAVATVVVLAAPAFAHPVFSNDEPGFPNPMGGTGGPGQTPPYPAGSRPTLNMFLPFEQDGVVFRGAENTTVDVRVTIPTAWSSPSCGPARTSPTVGYRQLGTVVAGWSCAIETVNGHQVLHWSGPQVSSAQTHDDSAQFFTFQVTMPSPTATTSYGATGGPEGIHVKQVYANAASSSWAPPNDPSAGDIAPGIVRSVARTTAPPPTPSAKLGGTTQGGTTQGGTTQGGTTQGGTTQGGVSAGGRTSDGATSTSSAPLAQPGGSGPATSPAAGAPPTEPTTAANSPSADPQNSPTTTPTQSSSGAETQPSSVEQLTQRDSAKGQGLRWQAWVGILLGGALLGAAVIIVIKRKQRAS